MSRSPVALTIFNRIHTLERVLERLAIAQPPMLLIIGDAPRADRPSEDALVAAARRLATSPPWPCEVRTNFSDTNLGPGRRIATGLEWVFREVEEAVVLEDDCLPEPTFFDYCDELLERYRDDSRVMMISGDNYQFGQRRGDGSYYFSRSVGTHGWASWRRAFARYDFRMQGWPDLKRAGMLRRVWPSAEAVEYWERCLDQAWSRDVDTWDYQWAFAIWSRGGVQIVPEHNLVRYIGCGADSANTSDPALPFCEIPTRPISLPLVAPSTDEPVLVADMYEHFRIFRGLGDAESRRRAVSGSD
jgi:hypothetical protein